MRKVVIESPYAGTSWFPPLRWLQRMLNIRYARKCMRDCLERGEAPIASHLLYTQQHILDDEKPFERQWGIDAGFLWNRHAEATVIYMDRGVSSGMKQGEENAREAGRVIERRYLDIRNMRVVHSD